MANVDAKAKPKQDPHVTDVSMEYAQGIMDMRFLNGSARALLTLSDTKVYAFEWFHDEITYKRRDFIGKTMAEVREMHRKRDLEYLRAP